MNTKTISGIKMIGGVLLTVVCGRMAAWANGVTGTPDLDWYYDIWAWAGTFGALGGLVLFFFGAKAFAENTKSQ